MKKLLATMGILGLMGLSFGQALAVQVQVYELSATISPLTATLGQTQEYTITLTNSVNSNHDIKSALVTIPAGFSIITASVTDPSGWDVSTTTQPGYIAIKKASGLNPGSSITLLVNATAPSIDVTSTWTIQGFGGTTFNGSAGDTFVVTSTMPVVTVGTGNQVTMYTFSYTAGTNGAITGSTTQILESGANGTAVTAVADSGYHFVNWDDASTANPRTDLNASGNISVTANFEADVVVPTLYTLTYNAGTNGALTGSTTQILESGANGTAVTATADPGYHFVSWSDLSTSNPRTDTNVTGNLTLTANFAADVVEGTTHTLTYAAGTHGSLTGTAFQTVNEGENGTAVTAVADSGYHFVDWSDNSTDNPRTDMNVMSDVSVMANFAVDANEENPNAPVITLVGNSELIVSVGTTFVDPGATATDLQDGDLTSSIIVTGTVDSATPGNYELTYTVTDSDQLSDSTTRMVHVVETLGGAGGSSGIVGCTDPAATNYNAAASVGSTCTYSTVPTGEVLGAATSTTPTTGAAGEVLGASTSTLSCSEYLSLNQGLRKKALREAAKNDPQLVTLLQKYLNDYISANLPLTGYFGPMTTTAVKKLQMLHKDSILAPWKLTNATGIVYVTTVAHINNTVCPALNIKVNADDLVPESR